MSETLPTRPVIPGTEIPIRDHQTGDPKRYNPKPCTDAKGLERLERRIKGYEESSKRGTRNGWKKPGSMNRKKG